MGFMFTVFWPWGFEALGGKGGVIDPFSTVSLSLSLGVSVHRAVCSWFSGNFKNSVPAHFVVVFFTLCCRAVLYPYGYELSTQ